MNSNNFISRANRSRYLDASLVGDLWFFAEAARHKSFGAAARELYVTQGAVSQRIKHLEDRLEAKLFIRVGRRAMLTPIGEAVFDAVDESFNGIENRISSIFSKRERVGIVVSCTPSVSMEWLLPRLSAWYSFSKNAKVQVRAEYHRVDQETMMSEGIDVAIRYDRENYDELHVINLFEERIFPVCTDTYWRDNHMFRDISALRRLSLLHDADPWVDADHCIEWQSWIEAQHASQIDISHGAFFNLAQMAVRAALLHQGVAMGRSILVADHLANGRLMRPFGAAFARGASYRFLTVAPPSHDSIEAQLANWMKEQLANSVKHISPA